MTDAAAPTDRLVPELTVTVGTGWTYIGNGDALRLRSILPGGVALIEVATASRVFPGLSSPSQPEEPS